MLLTTKREKLNVFPCQPLPLLILIPRSTLTIQTSSWSLIWTRDILSPSPRSLLCYVYQTDWAWNNVMNALTVLNREPAVKKAIFHFSKRPKHNPIISEIIIFFSLLFHIMPHLPRDPCFNPKYLYKEPFPFLEFYSPVLTNLVS